MYGRGNFGAEWERRIRDLNVEAEEPLGVVKGRASVLVGVDQHGGAAARLPTFGREARSLTADDRIGCAWW